jgi:putative membrane protein
MRVSVPERQMRPDHPYAGVMGFLLRVVVSAAALAAAAWLLDDISFTGPDNEVLTLLGVALIFGVINAFVAPVVKLLSLPFIILTLGLLLWVINAVMLLLTSAIADWIGLGFEVDGFGTALLGALIISVVTAVLNTILDD